MQVCVHLGVSTHPTPHPGLYNQLEPLCIMLACALPASKAPTPKPCDALSCPQHAVPMHAQHGGSTPCRASDPEIIPTVPSFLMWRPTALEPRDSVEPPHGALGGFQIGLLAITRRSPACLTRALAFLTSSHQDLSNDV